MSNQPECVFCQIVAGTMPATVLAKTPHTLVFQPLNPHAPGHVLVIPRRHINDATMDDRSYAGLIYIERTFVDAALYATGLGVPFNIITSSGEKATQSVFHLHVHVVPRGPGDGLAPGWPWSAAPEPEALRSLRAQRDAARAVCGYREKELLDIKGPCSTCHLHYAHSGPCDIKPRDE